MSQCKVVLYYLFICSFHFLDGCSLDSTIQPVIITLRHLALGADPTAAYWDFDLLDGHGGWRSEGCHITGSAGNTTTIHCTQHKNFAVLMVSCCITPCLFVLVFTSVLLEVWLFKHRFVFTNKE